MLQRPHEIAEGLEWMSENKRKKKRRSKRREMEKRRKGEKGMVCFRATEVR